MNTSEEHVPAATTDAHATSEPLYDEAGPVVTSTPTWPADASPVATPAARSRRLRARAGRVVNIALIVLLVCCSTSLLISYTGQQASAGCAPATDDQVLAGAATADITPHEAVNLGGYGIGPARHSTGVLQPLFARALAVRSGDGRSEDTLVFAALDSQGYFSAYQNGPYGLDDIRATAAKQLDMPMSHIIIAATHSHAAPDTVGFWGGVPSAYLAYIHDQTIAAITQAVSQLAPARLDVGTGSIAGYTTSFDTDEHSSSSWPADTQLRTLRAVSSADGHTIATLVNMSVHPTTLGAANTQIAPDWPGVVATNVEQALGGTAVIMIGALGHTWPGLPAGVYAPVATVAYLHAYADAITAIALAAVKQEQVIAQPTICVADRHFRESITTSPLLLMLQTIPGQTHVMRATQAPAFVLPNVVGVEVEAVRIGTVAFFTAPAEPNPSLYFDLRGQTRATTTFIFGLADDQLGYAGKLSEFPGTVVNSPTDEGLFIINPNFGQDILTELQGATRDIKLSR